MLTIKVAKGFSPAQSYPTYKYISKSGKGLKAIVGGGRIVPVPKGYREVIVHPDIDADFAEYLKLIEDEHKGFRDEDMIVNPTGIFLGRWRNARWQDEVQRRGLVKNNRKAR